MNVSDQEKLDAIYRAVTQAVPRLEGKCDKHASDIACVDKKVAIVATRVDALSDRLASTEKRSTGFGSIAGGAVAGALMFLNSLWGSK